jgi:hypothetical protein
LPGRRIDIGPADFQGEAWNYFAADFPQADHAHGGKSK